METKQIENIFSFNKTKDLCPNKNQPIIIDTREKNSMILANLKQKKANTIQKKLEVGDYSIGEVTIERKTITDLISSLTSNRLKEQLKNLKQCQKPLIIIEKSSIKSNIHPNALTGIILSINLNYKIPIVYTNSEEHTSEILIQIAKREKKASRTNQNKIPKTIEEQKRFILESFPGIGPKTSKELIKDFKNLKKIFNTSEEELNKILPEKIIKKFLTLLKN